MGTAIRTKICPIPRCSMEWLLGLGTFGMGIWLLIFPHSLQLHQYFASLRGPVEWHLVLPLLWSMALLLSGSFQITALLLPYDRPQHWASIAGFLAWGFVGVGFYNAGLLLILWPVLVFLVGEFFIALMLKPVVQ